VSSKVLASLSWSADKHRNRPRSKMIHLSFADLWPSEWFRGVLYKRGLQKKKSTKICLKAIPVQLYLDRVFKGKEY